MKGDISLETFANRISSQKQFYVLLSVPQGEYLIRYSPFFIFIFEIINYKEPHVSENFFDKLKSSLARGASQSATKIEEAAKTGKPDLTYQLSGRIHLETSGLTPSTIPFKTTGKISLEDTFGKIVE